MAKKTKKKKKLKQSDILYNLMNEKTKEYAREIKILIQKYSSVETVKQSDIGVNDFDLTPYEYLLNFDYENAKKELDNKKALEVKYGSVDSITRNLMHISIMSNIGYNKRVKYLKDLEEWENPFVVDSLNCFMSDNLNYINKECMEQLKEVAEAFMYDEYLDSLADKSAEIILDFNSQVIDIMKQGVMDCILEIQDVPMVKLQLLTDYSVEYMKEHYNAFKMGQAVSEKLKKTFLEEIMYLLKNELEALNNAWNIVLSNMKLDDMKETENESTVFVNRTWKELESLAFKAGYKYDRSNGDHGIYYNENNQLLMIPRGRTIGKGLQIAITKRIEETK